MPVILDTTFLIDLERDDHDAQDMLRFLKEQGEALLIPTIVLAEFLEGIPQPDSVLSQVMAGSQILPFTDQDALAGAKYAQERKSAGDYPGRIDSWIAGVSINHSDLAIVTRNGRHFPGRRTIGY